VVEVVKRKRNRNRSRVVLDQGLPPELAQRRLAIREQGLKTSGIGATLGNLILPGLGGLLGNAAEGLFKTILGKGDYVAVDNLNEPLPQNNTVMGLSTPGVAQQVMQMHSSGICTRVTHREFIGNYGMSSGFSAQINPIYANNVLMFPWLSTIAPNWQKYKILGMVFEYVPTSTNAISAGTPAVGSIAMCMNYDAYAPVPTAMANLLNTQGAVSCRPQDSMVCAVECDPGVTPTNPLFIDVTGAGPDSHWYVFGNLITASQGPAAYSGAGQIWVSYDLLLISPWIESSSSEVSLFHPRDDQKDQEVVVPANTGRSLATRR
jgi:hypothetical protein